MNDFDPDDLMAVCEVILEDGELSGREVYRLSQWLNDNPAAGRQWPGNLLVQPLQRVWADGALSTAELQEIGRLLLRVHSEWAEKHHGDILDSPPDLPNEMFNKLDLSRARLPSIPWKTRIRSGGSGAVFHVDLDGPSCTCPDWQTNRSALPKGHLSRCCRHILSAFGRAKREREWPGWMGAFIAHRWMPHPLKHWMIVQVQGAPVLASTAPIDWADVFAPAEEGYERFGFHRLENRWAYDSRPEGSEIIRGRIIAATAAAAVDPQAVRRVRIRLPAPLPVRGG